MDAWSFIGGWLVAVGATIAYQEFALFRERKSKRRDFPFQAMLVRDECYANLQTLKIINASKEPPPPLSSNAYDAYQLDLSRRLPAEVRDAVRHAYVYARAPRVLERRSPTGKVTMSSPVVQDA